MAKSLIFDFEGAKSDFVMHKVDRSKLYGFKIQEVLDENGDECDLITLAGDGKTLIGKGGTGIGHLTADGNWVEKGDLIPVDLEGEKITPVPSSFAAPIPLTKECNVDKYLEHNIRLVYTLEPADVPDELIKSLTDGAIYMFDYSYRGGLEPDAGFLLMNDEDEIFFLVGDPTHVQFVGLQQAAAATAEPDEPDSDSLMDFGMI